MMTSQLLQMQVIQPVRPETSDCYTASVEFRYSFRGRIVDLRVHNRFPSASQGDLIEAVSPTVVSFCGCVTSPDTVMLDFC
jgi:hypothetical protein